MEQIQPRSVNRLIDSQSLLEGGGFPVHRPFPKPQLSQIDPFLLLDQMGPVEWAPGEAIGAPEHPHKGFETITYLLCGKMAHQDSAGHKGTLLEGSVQRMIAGKGILHEELPHPDFLNQGGLMHGVQIWINLPSQFKLSEPEYQDFDESEIPCIESSMGLIKIIIGEYAGLRSPVQTRQPTCILHVTLSPGQEFHHVCPGGWNVFAYLLEGEGKFGPDSKEHFAKAGQLVLFNDNEGQILAKPTQDRVEFLLMGGLPIKEPIMRHGPFVMNNREEIEQALFEYQSGYWGSIAR